MTDWDAFDARNRTEAAMYTLTNVGADQIAGTAINSRTYDAAAKMADVLDKALCGMMVELEHLTLNEREQAAELVVKWMNCGSWLPRYEG